MTSLRTPVLALALAYWAPTVGAQAAYPARPIHLIVPLSAGSAVDNAMRILTECMAQNLWARISSSITSLVRPGLPGFDFNSWATVVAPSGTPREIVARLNAEIARALCAPDVRDKHVAQGLTPRGSSIKELRQATREQLNRNALLIRQAGIKLE